MIVAAVIIYVAGCALLNRYRGNGGAWGPNLGHTAKRVLASAWIALPALMIDPITYMVVTAMLWVIGFMPGWGLYFDFLYANEPGGEVWWVDQILRKLNLKPFHNDLVGMSLRGLHFTAPTAIFIAGYTQNPAVLLFAPVGLAMGVAYALAYQIDSDERHYIPAAEIVWGGLLGLILIGMAAI